MIAEVGFFLWGLRASVVDPLAPLGQRSDASASLSSSVASGRNFRPVTCHFLLVLCGRLCHNDTTFFDGHPGLKGDEEVVYGRRLRDLKNPLAVGLPRVRTKTIGEGEIR